MPINDWFVQPMVTNGAFRSPSLENSRMQAPTSFLETFGRLQVAGTRLIAKKDFSSNSPLGFDQYELLVWDQHGRLEIPIKSNLAWTVQIDAWMLDANSIITY